MPRREDPSKKIDPITGKQYSTYVTRVEASKKYDKDNVDNIRVRVPKGWKEQMQDYVAGSDKYNSVNGMICDLIRKEVGIEIESND